jgi:small subunit ribosomal protein S2
MFQTAYNFIVDAVSQGKEILFVGTKKQSQEAIKEEAIRCGMPYVNQRWLGGMLTNFITIKKSIDRLNTLSKMFDDDSIKAFPKKEITKLQKEKEKLEDVLGGIRNMKSYPAAVFIVDPNREHIAVQEAKKLKIPIVGIVDTNCDPDNIDYIIPGNDDAIRAIKLFASKFAEAVAEGRTRFEEKLAADSNKEMPIAVETHAAETDIPESVEMENEAADSDEDEKKYK